MKSSSNGSSGWIIFRVIYGNCEKIEYFRCCTVVVLKFNVISFQSHMKQLFNFQLFQVLCTILFSLSHVLCTTAQWRIQDFPGEGALTPKGRTPTYYLANFPRKLLENEQILGQRVGSLAPPRSATAVSGWNLWKCCIDHMRMLFISSLHQLHIKRYPPSVCWLVPWILGKLNGNIGGRIYEQPLADGQETDRWNSSESYRLRNWYWAVPLQHLQPVYMCVSVDVTTHFVLLTNRLLVLWQSQVPKDLCITTRDTWERVPGRADCWMMPLTLQT